MTGQRQVAIDIARGLAVVGVVFSHSVVGLVNARIVASESALAVTNESLYLFRMAAITFLLGLFVPLGVERHGAAGYLRHRLPLLAWLYVIWFFIQGSIEVLTSGVRNGSDSWGSLLHLWVPPAQLWFLPFLMVVTGLLVLLRPWRPSVVGRLALVGCVLISVAFWGQPLNLVGVRGLALTGFAAIGAVIGLRRMAQLMSGGLIGWSLVAGVALLMFLALDRATTLVPPTVSRPVKGLDTDTASFVSAGAGVVVVLGLGVALARWRVAARPLSFLGRRTLEVFVAHITITAAVRIALVQLGVTSAVVHVVSAVVLGTLLPLAAAVLAPRLRLEWLFALPSRWQRRSTAQPV